MIFNYSNAKSHRIFPALPQTTTMRKDMRSYADAVQRPKPCSPPRTILTKRKSQAGLANRRSNICNGNFQRASIGCRKRADIKLKRFTRRQRSTVSISENLSARAGSRAVGEPPEQHPSRREAASWPYGSTSASRSRFENGTTFLNVLFPFILHPLP